MKRSKRAVLCTLLTMAGPGFATPLSPDLGRVVGLLRDTIAIYDKDGNFIEKRPKWVIARGGIEIVDVNEKGQFGIHDARNQTVYVRGVEVNADRPDPCLAANNPSRSGVRIAAAEGVGSGMSGKAARCIIPQ